MTRATDTDRNREVDQKEFPAFLDLLERHEDGSLQRELDAVTANANAIAETFSGGVFALLAEAEVTITGKRRTP